MTKLIGYLEPGGKTIFFSKDEISHVIQSPAGYVSVYLKHSKEPINVHVKMDTVLKAWGTVVDAMLNPDKEM